MGGQALAMKDGEEEAVRGDVEMSQAGIRYQAIIMQLVHPKLRSALCDGKFWDGLCPLVLEGTSCV